MNEHEVLKVLVQVVYDPGKTRWRLGPDEFLKRLEWIAKDAATDATGGEIPSVSVVAEH